MLFTRESDYAIRVVRALKDGEKKSIRQICAVEEIPEAFCYKIVKKLEHAGVVAIVACGEMVKPAQEAVAV